MTKYYITSGNSFIDTLEASFPGITDTVRYIRFDYDSNITGVQSNWESIAIDENSNGSIQASVSADKDIIIIHSECDIYCTDCRVMFFDMVNLNVIKFKNFNTDECTSMKRMFMNCKSLQIIDIRDLSSNLVADFTEMFSHCSNCRSINISKFNLPSDNVSSTILYDDMFLGTTSLSKLTVGEKFTFYSSMSLSNPNSDISNSTGVWICPLLGTSYDVSELPSGVACTYYASDVTSNVDDSDIVTFGALKEAMKEIALSISRTDKWYIS